MLLIVLFRFARPRFSSVQLSTLLHFTKEYQPQNKEEDDNHDKDEDEENHDNGSNDDDNDDDD